MKRKNVARNALFTSVLSLLLCVSMLVGTTFAWFTDEVTSSNNIIKSGNLDVEMYWADGTVAVSADDSNEWKDASTGAIFNYDLWEPGYTQVRHIKIANKGSLALKYKVNIIPNGEVSDLADVIDVYYMDPAAQVADRAELTDSNKLGTLTDVLAKLGETGNGELIAGASDTITIAFKMQETAGNEYMNKAIGTNFSVVLLATQLTSEEDSFDNQYDVDSLYPYVAIGGVTKEDAATAVKSEDESVMIEIPAEAPKGDYVLTVTDKSEKTDAEGNTTVSMDISLLKDGVKVADGNKYTVSVKIGAGLNLTKVLHKDVEITDYTYDIATGVLTFKTNHFSPFAFVYNTVGATVTTAEELNAALANGGLITLGADITSSKTFVVTKSTVINGNGKTITYTGAERAIDVPDNADAKVNVAIENLTVDCTASYCQRGVNYNDDGALVLNNVTIKGTNVTYALNLPGYSDNCVVEINNSDITGHIAMNIWGANSKVTATNTVFTSVDNTTAEGYVAISLNNDGAGNAATGSVVNINGGKIIAKNEKGEPSTAVRVETVAAVNVSAETEVIGSIVREVAIVTYAGYDEFYSFDNLQEAIDKAAENANATVKLLENIELTETVEIPKGHTVTIDLNGKTITAPAGAICAIQNLGTLTVTGNGTIEGSYTALYSNGNLTIEGGTFTATNGFGLLIDNIYGTEASVAVINGGIFTGVGIYNPTDVTVNGGTFNVGRDPDGATDHLSDEMALFISPTFVGAPNTAKVVLNGGTVNGDVYVYDDGITETVFVNNGATITGEVLDNA